MREAALDGVTLLDLDDADLQELKVMNHHQRSHILDAIADLKANNTEATLASTGAEGREKAVMNIQFSSEHQLQNISFLSHGSGNNAHSSNESINC